MKRMLMDGGHRASYRGNALNIGVYSFMKSIYETYADGRRAPCKLSRERVKHRSVLIYEEGQGWDAQSMKEFVELIDRLEMRRVYLVEDAKFIVIKGRPDDEDRCRVREELMFALAKEY